MKISLFLTLTLFTCNYFFAQDWNVSFDEALQKAQTSNKNVVLIFSGSDWCAPCIKLDKTVWQSDVFKNEASKNWELYKADFPRKKANKLSDEQIKYNRSLAEIYNKDGSFPLIVMIDKNGKILGKMGFKNVSAEEYVILMHHLEK